MAMKFLNLACGSIYLVDDCWINIDFQYVGSEVIGHDLLKPLPFKDSEFDLVYSSHFIEHIPRRHIHSFLLECKRVLKPGGTLRLVLPDSEEMFTVYLDLRSKGMHREADFVMIEIIDQCVRDRSGGELGEFYSRVRLMNSKEQAYWNSFLAKRNGETLKVDLSRPRVKDVAKQRNAYYFDFSGLALKLSARARMILHRLGLKMLLPAFKRQNISFAGIGEKHCWLWDFHQLQTALQCAGFTAVSRQTHLSSHHPSFPFYPLDATAAGEPRKGDESMFVEALLQSCHSDVALIDRQAASAQ